jgi:hypothetical protein
VEVERVCFSVAENAGGVYGRKAGAVAQEQDDVFRGAGWGFGRLGCG